MLKILKKESFLDENNTTIRNLLRYNTTTPLPTLNILHNEINNDELKRIHDSDWKINNHRLPTKNKNIEKK